MLQRQRQTQAGFHKLLDAALFAFAFWFAHWIRADNSFLAPIVETFGGTVVIPEFSEYAWVLWPIVLLTPFLLELQGFYSRPLLASRWLTARELAQGCAMVTLAVIVALFTIYKQQYPRFALLILFPITSFVLVLAKEELVRRWAMSKHGLAQLQRRLIVIGTAEETDKVEARLAASDSNSVKVVARFNLNEAPIERFVELLHEHSVNAVVINANHTDFGAVEKAIQACELEGIEAWLLTDFFNTQLSRTVPDDFFGKPVLIFRTTLEDSWQGLAKQILDVVGGVLLLVVASPLFLAVTAAIKLTSPGPVFFRQRRSGLNGQPFVMLKFRSMVTDAEQRKHEVEVLNEMSGPVFKVSEDPRVTPIGRWLRKFSLDELPQLVNVVFGEMSLVGPRPLPVDETLRFGDFAHRRRLSVKPGMTCLWQISGRNEVKDFKDWIRLDLEYIDNWSLWLDLKILARTIPVVLAGTGAR